MASFARADSVTCKKFQNIKKQLNHVITLIAACPDSWYLVRETCKCLGVYYFPDTALRADRSIFEAQSKAHFISFFRVVLCRVFCLW